MKNQRIIRFLIVLCLAALIFSLIYFAFVVTMPDLIPVLKSGEEGQIESYLRRNGNLSGMICTALLQGVQVLSIVLPGAPVQIAAGIVYGALYGMLICYVAYVCVNLLVFYLARKLSGKLDELLPTKEGWLSRKLRFLKDSEMPVYMTAMATIIPLVPNGVIPYAAAKTDMRFGQFALAVCLGAVMPIAVMSTIGSRILEGDYLLAVIVFGFSLVIVALLTKFRVQIMKMAKKITKNFLGMILMLVS